MRSSKKAVKFVTKSVIPISIVPAPPVVVMTPDANVDGVVPSAATRPSNSGEPPS